ncbi:MAG TPA: ATP-binding protein [Kofleriaceae bacterium]|nr:ATP-binding protein [Kofleriaceae bacterium]
MDAPFSGGTTSGLTAIDRARRGERGAVRVLVVGDAAQGGARLALAVRAEGFTITTATGASAEAALAEAHPHAIVLDGAAVPRSVRAHVLRRWLEAAPSVPIVVVGPIAAPAAADGDDDNPDGETAWIDAGADEHLDDESVTPPMLRRAIESAIARVRARDLRRRLEHADRLTTIGQLAAGVAHEVNNPAAFLLMNLRTCREYVDELRETIGVAAASPVSAGDGAPIAGLALLDEMAEMLEDNVRGVERIVAIVEALRGYVRTDGDQPSSIELVDVCRDAAALVAARVRRHAKLDLALELASVVRVHADPRRLAQVIVNLLTNAADACEAAADHAPPSGHRVAITIERRGADVVIRVSDTGAGMSAPVRARAFQPFFTTKPRGRGTGLGLAIARDIVERYGGRIEIDSELGHGSRFDVVLPVDESTPLFARGSAGGALAVAAATKRRTRVRVLVIDDEEPLATALTRQLRRYHDVTVAPDGATALALIGDAHAGPPFDAILCDVNMPGLDGPAVHAALARRGSPLARCMIFMTGGLFGDDMRAAISATGAAVIGKPLALSPLLDAIEAARLR